MFGPALVAAVARRAAGGNRRAEARCSSVGCRRGPVPAQGVGELCARQLASWDRSMSVGLPVSRVLKLSDSGEQRKSLHMCAEGDREDWCSRALARQKDSRALPATALCGICAANCAQAPCTARCCNSWWGHWALSGSCGAGIGRAWRGTWRRILVLALACVRPVKPAWYTTHHRQLTSLQPAHTLAAGVQLAHDRKLVWRTSARPCTSAALCCLSALQEGPIRVPLTEPYLA